MVMPETTLAGWENRIRAFGNDHGAPLERTDTAPGEGYQPPFRELQRPLPCVSAGAQRADRRDRSPQTLTGNATKQLQPGVWRLASGGGGMKADRELCPKMFMSPQPLRALIRMGGYAAMFRDEEAVSLHETMMPGSDAELHGGFGVKPSVFLSQGWSHS